MATETKLLYLEPDDEITTLVRRLRETDADAARVVIVASGRARATSSATALRLLARLADEEGREIALVADAAARALAGEAGISGFASVAEATADGAIPAPPPSPKRATIHVVRDEPARVPAASAAPLRMAAPSPAPAQTSTRPLAAAPSGSLDETQAVPIPVPQPQRRSAPTRPAAAPSARPRTAASRRQAAAGVLILLVVFLAAAAVAGAIMLPAATITIRPAPVHIGPLTYTVSPQVHSSDAEPLESTMQGEATGHRTRRTAATGAILLINYSDSDVLVDAGTVVSADGTILFQTTQPVTVPDANFFFPGTATTPVEALEPGPGGNVDALAIDRIEDRDVDHALRGPGPDQRRVRNEEPTSGGDEQELLVVTKADVDGVKQAVRADLRHQLEAAAAGAEDRIYVDNPPAPRIPVPDDLVGRVSDQPQLTFELTGSLVDERPYVLRGQAEAAAQDRLLGDRDALPSNSTLVDDTVRVELGQASRDGDEISVRATVRADAIPTVDADGLRSQLAGKTATEVESLLGDVGDVRVDFWPGWVDRVPGIESRVDVRVEDAARSTGEAGSTSR